jgi:hypothetical protein
LVPETDHAPAWQCGAAAAMKAPGENLTARGSVSGKARPIRLPGLAQIAKGMCQAAGAIPKTEVAERARAHKRVLGLLREGVSPKVGRILAAYFSGRYDLKGRPPDRKTYAWFRRIAFVKRETGCTWDAATKTVVENEILPLLPKEQRDYENYFEHFKNRLRKQPLHLK